MAIGIYFAPVSMTSDLYDRCVRRLEERGAGKPPGRLYHARFGEKNKFDRFGRTLMPILKELGIDAGAPQFHADPQRHSGLNAMSSSRLAGRSSHQRLAAIAACLVSLAVGGEAQQPSFSTSSDLVVVPTVVLDRKGALVRGLDVGTFQVFEDGRRTPIETFVAPDAQGSSADGRFIVLILDNLRTRAELGTRVQNIARKFADRMEPSDVLSTITLESGRSSTAGTPAEVRAAINRFRPALGESIRTEAEAAQHGLETIGALAKQLSRVQHRRKVLVFIGAASMFSPKDESAFFDRGPELNPRWFDAIRFTGQENVAVYVIDPEGQTGEVDDYSEGFAELTGGHAWVNTANFDSAVNQIWQESGSYYLVGYRPPINDHRLHKIEVKVSVPNTTVRARRARG
jgi:VWFA-related protein